MRRRVAALDCGTNTVRLLVADIDDTPDGAVLTDVERHSEIVRLGQGVDRTGVLADDALARTRAALERYAARVAATGVDAAHTRLVATSATRDARNRDVFVEMVRSTLGVDPEVVPGEEEAALAFAGATRELLADPSVDPPFLVVDIGGGSTELVVGTGHVEVARSMDVGSVRLTERHLADDPPTDAQVAAAVADVDAVLDDVLPLVGTSAKTLVAVAGTATTLSALALGLDVYDAAAVHHSRISTDTVDAVVARLRASTAAQIRAMGPVPEKRADVLTAGALILQTVLHRCAAAGYLASEHDILDGIAWSILARTADDRPMGPDGDVG
ncbi:MAG TPA: exopolyphosphatase [Mycobacteriales bacterium]|nr:exopolyphosphatase [Mycobacteriales bacterium]